MLELADLLRQRGLCQVFLVCGAGKASRPGYGAKVSELMKLHLLPGFDSASFQESVRKLPTKHNVNLLTILHGTPCKIERQSGLI
jgi:hypothetical protein